MNLHASLFAAFFYPCFLVVVFVWPSWRTYRQTGRNPVVFGRSDSAHDYIGRCFKGLLTVVAAAIAVSLAGGGAWLLPVPSLALPAAQLAGAALCGLALVWTAIAQAQMGRSWRIGIDRKRRTDLHTSGLFSLSRNPVFVGMLASLLGLFFLLPNAVTLVCLAVGHLLIQIAVRLEEEHLRQLHGAVYQQYKDRVRRWL